MNWQICYNGSIKNWKLEFFTNLRSFFLIQINKQYIYINNRVMGMNLTTCQTTERLAVCWQFQERRTPDGRTQRSNPFQAGVGQPRQNLQILCQNCWPVPPSHHQSKIKKILFIKYLILKNENAIFVFKFTIRVGLVGLNWVNPLVFFFSEKLIWKNKQICPLFSFF